VITSPPSSGMHERRAGGDAGLTIGGGAPDAAPELSIIVPASADDDCIAPILRGLTSGLHTSHEILVVVGVEDEPAIRDVRALAAELPQVRILPNVHGGGVLGAVKVGIAASRGDLVLITRADGTSDLTIVESMVRLAHLGADVVVASRYVRGGRQVGGPLLERALTWLAGRTFQSIAGVPIHDPTNTFALYSRELLGSIVIESSTEFELPTELTVKAALDGRMIAEVPTTSCDRPDGEGRMQVRDWLPRYVRWCMFAFRGPPRRRSAVP
jgi:dolichol-phosphate mannosyltransferase